MFPRPTEAPAADSTKPSLPVKPARFESDMMKIPPAIAFAFPLAAPGGRRA